jgi:hypothetical protein
VLEVRVMVLLGTRGWDLKAWKYRVAYLLDRLPWTCWVRLVTWVEYGSPLREAADQAGCWRDAVRCGRCYCGKVGKPAENAPVADLEPPY